MLLNFSVQNFGSVKDKQTLTFEADKSDHLENTFVIHTNGLRILKMVLIYGANASGKTTILKALDFLRYIVLNPETKKTDEFNFNPFLFDNETINKNSVLSIEFIANDIKYYYELEFFKKAIVHEVLNFYHPNKAMVFKRTTDIENQLTEIKFGSKIKIDRTIEKTLEANTLWNNTVLGGFLKTNVDIKELKEVVEWFKSYLGKLVQAETGLEMFTTKKIDKGELSKDQVINILQKADFRISDIFIRKDEIALPDGFIDHIRKQLPDEEVKQIEAKGKVTSIDLEFEHTVDQMKYYLPFDLESHGTRRFYGFAGLLALLINKPTLFPIDELEASLHPDLYVHFILSFLLNANNSQLLATTHNREILANKDIFRNDAIWFTDKTEHSATELYSLADFDSSVVRNTKSIFNAYKSGKLRATPNVSDHFIDLSV